MIKKKQRLRINEPSTGFKIFNFFILLIITLTMLIPLWNVTVYSFTTDLESYEHTLKLWPKQFSFAGYKTLFESVKIWLPFINNVYITVIGTILHVMVNALAGFVLTRKRFPGKGFIVLIFLIPMMIPGESIIIPRYLVMKQLGLINSLWSVIVNNIANTFAIFLMRNYFMSIPISLEESAKIDGASLFTLFKKIYLPLSTAGLATISLIEMVGKWNTLFSAVLYINIPERYTLQQALKVLIVNTESPFTSGLSIPNNAQAAGVIVALVPILLFYPYIQKYFIKGIYLGSIKE